MRTILFRQSILAAILFSCIVPLTGCNRQPVEAKPINVIFRFDDYSALSVTGMELKIIDAFRKNEASITFGVIPFICAGDVLDLSPQAVVPLSSIKGDILKAAVQEGILEVALHGYSHQTISAKRITEFSGLDYNSQVERLTKGKKLLEDMVAAPITTFVPPWNSYDQNTLRALQKLGFSTISADKKGETTADSMLNFLPATCTLSQLRDAVEAARRSSDTQSVIVVMFHVYDFKEVNSELGNITYQQFSDLLNWLKSQRDVRLLSINQATKVISDLSAHRFLLNKRIDSLLKLLPPSFVEGNGNQYIDSAKLLIILWLRISIFYLIIVTLVTLASFMIGYLVLPKSIFMANISVYRSMAISIIMLIYTFHKLNVNFKGMVVCAGVVGVSIGLWLCVLYLRKKRLLDLDEVSN